METHKSAKCASENSQNLFFEDTMSLVWSVPVLVRYKDKVSNRILLYRYNTVHITGIPLNYSQEYLYTGINPYIGNQGF